MLVPRDGDAPIRPRTALTARLLHAPRTINRGVPPAALYGRLLMEARSAAYRLHPTASCCGRHPASAREQQPNARLSPCFRRALRLRMRRDEDAAVSTRQRLLALLRLPACIQSRAAATDLHSVTRRRHHAAPQGWPCRRWLWVACCGEPRLARTAAQLMGKINKGRPSTHHHH